MTKKELEDQVKYFRERIQEMAKEREDLRAKIDALLQSSATVRNLEERLSQLEREVSDLQRQ